jgi:hypothetical protein
MRDTIYLVRRDIKNLRYTIIFEFKSPSATHREKINRLGFVLQLEDPLENPLKPLENPINPLIFLMKIR